jgi:hypothetical protein
LALKRSSAIDFLGIGKAIRYSQLVKPEDSVVDPPMAKPGHLESQPAARDWIVANMFALTAFAMGIVAFVVVVILQQQLWASPDWRVTIPMFVVTAGLASVSIIKKESTIALPLLGIGLAAAATVMGWFLITAIVVAVAAVVILIMSHVM